MVDRNRLSSGFGLVRLRGGHQISRSPLIVQPGYNPVEFKLIRPVAARHVRTSNFIFVGIDPATLVDMAFVRAEHRRLTDLPRMFSAGEIACRYHGPPSGQIV